MICVLLQSSNVELRLLVSIDDFELQTILLRFQLHVEKKVNSKVMSIPIAQLLSAGFDQTNYKAFPINHYARLC